MNHALDFRIVNDDILRARSDVVALKYAGAFYGADKAVANAIEFTDDLDAGQHVFVQGSNIEAREVLFIGVGPLQNFRYQEIQTFGRSVLELTTKERPRAATLALTMHGPGYGLDEREAFLSLISGLHAAWLPANSQLKSVSIFERSPTRAARLEQLLLAMESRDSSTPNASDDKRRTSKILALADYGTQSEEKSRLFIAMPFKSEYSDEYDIAFTEAAHKNGFLCERLDLESFVGDVVSEIKHRILSSNGVIALLNDHNPNVFLEIGFAMAHGKPIILVVKKPMVVPFDVRGQRYLEYTRIHELRETLALEISKLKSSGVFDSRSKVT